MEIISKGRNLQMKRRPKFGKMIQRDVKAYDFRNIENEQQASVFKENRARG